MPEITIRRMTMDDVDGVYAVEIGTLRGSSSMRATSPTSLC